MKRIFSLPAIGLLFCLLLAGKLLQAQTYFTAEVKGKGTPLILIHGLYCSGEVWKEAVEHYQKDYECHVLTLSGFGGTSPHLNDRFLMSVKDDIISYVKSKKLKKPLLMGHSMGAFISLWAGSSEPSLFGKIIVVDGLPFLPVTQNPNATVESSKPMAANVRDMMSNLTPDQIGSNQKMVLQNMISQPERIDQVVEIAKKADSKTQGQVVYEMFTTDLRDSVGAIQSPVLVLGSWIAYKNYGVTREIVLSMYTAQVAKIKNVKIEMSDDAKHFIFYDDPSWFFGKVDAFLK